MRTTSPLACLTAIALAACTATNIPGHSGSAPAPTPSTPAPGAAASAPAATTPAPPAAAAGTTPARPLPPAPITADQLAKLDNLLLLTRDLLNLAPDVARIRWNAAQGKPVAPGADIDAARGDAAARLARDFNADPDLVRDYFRAQSEASRYVQSALWAQWTRAGTPPTMTLIRGDAQVQAVSDRITPKLMRALADAAPALRAIGAKNAIAAHAKDKLPTRSALSDPTRAIAIRPLLDRASD
ncbi:hypothetical protein [Derxia gummosa]|uniref:Chorismate mutase n=1 Tax=Derxia gummosa DSM 723 TaxID=1121388 RepID=A0A8B6X1J0_9BURK|nr:hypothetical protein [Derxia gummosa]